MTETQVWISVAVIALVTALTRFLPFLIFGGDRKVPRIIEKLGGLLPYAIMGMLVVYCLKGVNFASLGGWVPALIACTVVVVLHVWRKNTLLSIISGTVVYMLLVQLIF